MNLTVLLIAVFLPLLPVMFFVLRSGAFGKGSFGTFLKLFFLGVLAAVPAFLMEAGSMLAVRVLLKILFPDAQGGGLQVVSAVLQYVAAAALIEEAWKHFVLRTTTWKQMTMERVGDGTAAAAAVGAGFSIVMYMAWQAGFHLIPADMESLRSAMPDFLNTGAVTAFVYALLFIPAHFGFSGFMGMLYGVAKGSDQKNHSGRAGFMLAMSFLLPMLLHGACAASIGYGMAAGKVLWLAVGFAAEAVLAMIMAIVLSGAHDAALSAAGAAAAAAVPAVTEGAAEAGEDAFGSVAETAEGGAAQGENPVLTLDGFGEGAFSSETGEAVPDGGSGSQYPETGSMSSEFQDTYRSGFQYPETDISTPEDRDVNGSDSQNAETDSSLEFRDMYSSGFQVPDPDGISSWYPDSGSEYVEENSTAAPGEDAAEEQG